MSKRAIHGSVGWCIPCLVAAACSSQDFNYLQAGRNRLHTGGTAGRGGSAGSSGGQSGSAGVAATGGAAVGGRGAGVGGTRATGGSGVGCDRTAGNGGADGLIELARGQPAAALTEETGKSNIASHGNDGLGNTRWCASSAALPQWWRVDLGVTRMVSRLDLTWERQTRYGYYLEVSDDDVSYTVIFDNSNNQKTCSPQSEQVSGQGRYVRINITSVQQPLNYVPVSNENWVSFWEFELYGPDGSAGAGAGGAGGGGGDAGAAGSG